MSTQRRSITSIFIIVFLIFLIVLISAPNTNAQDGPSVVSTKPEPSESGVPLDREIIVFFDENMSEQATKSAFSINPAVDNYKFEWHTSALAYVPKDNFAKLNANEEYTVTISTEAKNEDGINLAQSYSWKFTTKSAPKQESEEADFGTWNFWEPIVTGITVLGTILFTLYGVWRYRKRRSKLKDHITRLDEVYDKYRKDPYVCEHKLNQLKESLKIKFKSGEMEENHYLIMDKKIDDYLVNIRYRKTLTKPKIIGGPEGEIREQLEISLTDPKPELDDEFKEPEKPKRKGERKKEKGIGPFRKKPKDGEPSEPPEHASADISDEPEKPKKKRPPRIVPD
jgi:hypothetical protein